MNTIERKMWYSFGIIYVIVTSNKIIDTYYKRPNFKILEQNSSDKFNLWKYGILGN